MTIDNFNTKYKSYLDTLETRLASALSQDVSGKNDPVFKAAEYSLMAGGKRIRPVMMLAAADMLKADPGTAMDFACAIEMIHTYSLIHDDLPCMDDDDLRRGRPTCHKAFGEAIAVLAGDALLNRAFELILQAIKPERISTVAAGRYIAKAAGLMGMIAGQSMDLSAENKTISFEQLVELHKHKTGALIKAPIIAAGLLAESEKNIINLLEHYADAIGLAFQIQDDILDVTADQALLGKSTGKDARDNKSTYVSLLGLDGAKNRLLEADSQARAALDSLSANGFNTIFFEAMTDFLLNREY